MSRDDYYEHLQFIPYENEDGENYEIIKGACYDGLVTLKKNAPELTAANCVNYELYDNYYVDLNGVEKAIYIIASMLFQMELNEVDEQLAYEAHCDVADLETGKYDYLFTEEDLKLLKADMKIIRDYLNQHPSLCEL